MSEIEAIQAVGGLQERGQTSQSSSLGDYQRWLADSGNMPLDSVLTQHPSRIAASALDQAGGLTNSWNSHLNKTAEMFSDKRIESMLNEFRHGDAMPGPASVAQPTPSGEVTAGAAGSEADAPNSVEDAKKAAGDAIMDATARSIEMQWRQTAALIEHDLSNQILMSSMQSSISAGKEINEGLDSLLRG